MEADGVFVNFVVRVAAHGEAGVRGDVFLDIFYVVTVAGAGYEDVDHEDFSLERDKVGAAVLLAAEDGEQLGVQLDESGFHSFNIIK